MLRDETELIRAAATGDRRSFDELVRAKREQVVRVAFQVTGNLDDALDVAQGVFLKLWRTLGQFDTRRRFDTWLYRITVNAAIDQIRHRGPRGVTSSLDDEPDLPAEPAATPEARIDLARLERAFLHLAAGLAPKQRSAFVLKEIEGLETAEVARILGVTESTVRNHVLHARRALAAGLARDYPGLIERPREGRGGRDGRDGEDGT